MVLEKESILMQISKIIIEALGEEVELTEYLGGKAMNELELDSMTFISVITRMEEQFEIEFEDDDLEFLLYSSVEDAANLTYEKMKMKVGA